MVATPVSLPVFQSTKLEFVINRKTVQALALSVPLTPQAAAGEGIGNLATHNTWTADNRSGSGAEDLRGRMSPLRSGHRADIPGCPVRAQAVRANSRHQTLTCKRSRRLGGRLRASVRGSHDGQFADRPSFADWSREIACAFDETFDRRAERSILQGHDVDRPGPQRQIDGQYVER